GPKRYLSTVAPNRRPRTARLCAECDLSAIIANMIESYLAGGAPSRNAPSASTEQNSTRRRRVSCASLYQLGLCTTATRLFSIQTRKCKALFGQYSSCLSKRIAPTAWFSASTSSAFSLSTPRLRRRLGWQAHLGSSNPFTGDRRSCQPLLRRHLRLWALPIV